MCITLSELKKHFEHIGISKNDSIMLHASVRSIGKTLIGGPDIIIQALKEQVGPEGTLMMYVGWEDAPYHLSEWTPEKQEATLLELPAFDINSSHADRDHGVLAEFLRTTIGSVRSTNPGASCVALGKNAKKMLENHPLNYGYSVGSPLHHLCELKGKVLVLGSPLAHITLYHYSESLCKIPDKRIVKWKCPILINQQKKWVEIEEFDTSKGIVDWEEDYFPLISQDYISTTNYKPKKIGNADCYLFDANELNQFAIRWMEEKF